MSLDKIREDFEAWVKSEWPDTYLERVPFGEGRKLEGCYWEVYVQINWHVWQASRTSLVIQLPPEPPYPDEPEEAIDDSPMGAYHSAIRMRNACAQVIEAAGVKCK